ncbi:MAG: GNAT family protein [Casimicrobiaceae bacterium]
MKAEMTIRVGRVEIVAATLEHIYAELSGPNALALLLSAHVPDSWPPGEYDRDALEYFRAKFEEAPHSVGWYGWYVISLGADGSRQSAVGVAGYLGPPSKDGVVELGYSIVPEVRRRGYASAAIQALVNHALRRPRVACIVAHTEESNVASTAVLIHCGFERVGLAQGQGSSRYEYRRAAPNQAVNTDTPPAASRRLP